MSLLRQSIIAVIFLLPMLSFAEGTKQIMPASSNHGQLCFNKARNNFGFYNADAEFRINITIADLSESIRFGFGQVLIDNVVASDLVYRIKDPSGNVVLGAYSVPASGQGFISSYDQAVAGPFPSSGGYDYLEYKPVTTGNFYIEFSYPGTYSDANKHMLEYFDITVVDASESAIDGRVWSQAWHFWSGDPQSSSNSFYGKLMTYSDDSIVTQVNCNGLIGGEFSFSSNVTGCANTGNLMYDRKSRSGFYTYPQYKVFLNDPDSVIFPTQKITSGIVQPVLITTDCVTGTADFGIKVILDGTVELLIETNPNPGQDESDVKLITHVVADPGGDGYNHIIWNGIDNLGNPVSNGASLTLTVTYLSGLTHLPIYDIEYNPNGYIVTQVRPKGGQLKIYWDDTNIGGTYDTVSGCTNSGGCHTWSNAVGDNNTVNSWWYVTRDEVPSLAFSFEREPGNLALSGSNIYCIGTGNLQYTVETEPNSLAYEWSYSGTGVSIDNQGNTATLEFSDYATPGVLSVRGMNACGYGPAALMTIVFDSVPVVTLEPFTDICYTAPGFVLSGGDPAGGIYYVDGQQADSLYPYKEAEGLHSIVYTYSKASGCTGADTTTILLYSGTECEATIFFPNAFTPDGDGLNDIFKPVANEVYRYNMYIYDKWGQLLFSTDDVSEGWDGKFNGKACPTGLYSYTSRYWLSLREDDNKTTRGLVTLLR
jgi:gliding motility-associated-like protein